MVIMVKREPIEGLEEEERLLLIEALSTLRRERAKAWNKACDIAEAAGRRSPSLRRYGIDEIKRLVRRLGGRASYW